MTYTLTTGDDLFNGTGAADTIYGLDGADFISEQATAISSTSTNNSNVLFGNKGDDTLRAGSNGDTLYGGQDGDSLVGGNGADQLQGNMGNDSLFSSSGADSVFGGQGNDYIAQGSNTAITTQTGADTVWAGQGNDTIDYTGTDANVVLFGNIGSDSISGGNGADSIYGGQGGDTVSGNEGADVIYGDLGADSLNGGSGVDSIVGGAGNDTLSGGASSDFLTGGDGNDVFALLDSSQVGSSAVDTIYDFASGDTIAFNSVGLAALNGGSSAWWTTANTNSNLSSFVRTYTTLNDAANVTGNSFGFTSGGLVYIQSQGALYVAGTNASITTLGSASGMSQIANVTGSPSLSAANFTTSLDIGGLNTTTTTTTTSITTTGTSASEAIPGTAGNDVLFGGAGADTFTAAGNDTITDYVFGTDNLVVNSGATATLSNPVVSTAGTYNLSTGIINSGTIVLTGATGIANTFTGSAGAENFSVPAGSGADVLDGGSGNDTITGNASGSDNITGGAGNDSLVGGADLAAAAGDTITGGAGADTMTGGAGADKFAFASGDWTISASSVAGIDKITDLSLNVGTADVIKGLNGGILGAGNSVTVATSVSGSVSEASFVADMNTLLAVGGGAGFDTSVAMYNGALVIVNAGTLAGRTYLAVDVDASNTFTTADFVVDVTGVSITSFTNASFV